MPNTTREPLKFQPRKTEESPAKKEIQTREASKSDVRCYNCGRFDHLAANCPSREEGPKCFNCREFGHRAVNCKKGQNASTVNVCSVADNKVYKPVIIADKEISALLDIAGDVNLIRTDQRVRLGSPPLTGSKLKCKGVGSEILITLGSFHAEIKINDDVFKLLIHVISDACLEYNLLIGSDLLKEARILLESSNTRDSRREREVEVPSDTAEIFHINVIDEIENSETIFEYQRDIQSIKDAKISRREHCSRHPIILACHP